MSISEVNAMNRKKRRLPRGVFERPGRESPLVYFGVQVNGRWLRRPSPDNTIEGAVVARQEALARMKRGEEPFVARRDARGPVTVGEVVTRYAELLGKSPRSETAADLVRRQREVLVRHLGTVPVAGLDETALQGYREARAREALARKKGRRELRVATPSRELGFLRAALNSAREDDLIGEHVFGKLSKGARKRVLPDESEDGQARPFRGVSDEDFEALIGALPPVWERPVRLLFLLGVREREVFELRRGQVGSDTIRFSRRKRRKTVACEYPLTPEIRDLLSPLPADAEAYVFAAPRDSERSLLPSLGCAFARARVKAGRAWIRPHHLRYERASRMSEEGFSPTELRYLLGWSRNSPIPERVYLHASRTRMQSKLRAMYGQKVEGARVVDFPAPGKTAHETSQIISSA
jgi:integrase